MENIKRIAKDLWFTDLTDEEVVKILKEYPLIETSYSLQQKLWNDNRLKSWS